MEIPQKYNSSLMNGRIDVALGYRAKKTLKHVEIQRYYKGKGLKISLFLFIGKLKVTPSLTNGILL